MTTASPELGSSGHPAGLLTRCASSGGRQFGYEYLSRKSPQDRFLEATDFGPVADAEFDFAFKFLLVLNRISEPPDVFGEVGQVREGQDAGKD